MISSYQREQSDTLISVYRHIGEMGLKKKERLSNSGREYLKFRKDADALLSGYFHSICVKRCFKRNLSACCVKDGIIIHFADMVINVLFSEEAEIESLITVLEGEGRKGNCIYLGENGCLWRIKPIVCEMFICEQAKKDVLIDHPESQALLDQLEARQKLFTWPDKPVLFDTLERDFIADGISSPLMYFSYSPGLLSVKNNAKHASSRRRPKNKRQ